MELTQAMVPSLFNYEDGHLFWKVSKPNNIKIGDLAGTVTKIGYRTISINDKIYYTHRLIFLYHHGYLPEFLDHIDCNKLNNNIENLREATGSQNQWNREKNKSRRGKPTTSEYKGVDWHKRDKIWRAQIRIDNKGIYLGSFTNEIEAAKAYNAAATELFGEYACLNIIDASKPL